MAIGSQSSLRSTTTTILLLLFYFYTTTTMAIVGEWATVITKSSDSVQLELRQQAILGLSSVTGGLYNYY